jgi:hypothetical protein
MKTGMIILAGIGLMFLCVIGMAAALFIVRTESDAPPAPTVDAVLLSTPTPAGALPETNNPGGGEQPANPVPAPEQTTGGFNGRFVGALSGENGSSAPATLELTQTGDQVSGQLTVENGLTLDIGACGTQSVPPGTQTAAGRVDPANPNRIQTAGSFEAGGFTVGVTLTADLAADGQTVTANASLDLPFICGVDPSINGTFTRE